MLIIVDFSTSNKVNAGKISLLIYYLVGAIVLFLVVPNVPEEGTKAFYYGALGITYVIAGILDIVLDKIAPDKNPLDVYGYDTSTIFGQVTRGWRIFFLVSSLVLFFSVVIGIGVKPQYAILAPKFQTLNLGFAKFELGPVANNLVTALAAQMEDAIFFCFFLGLIRRFVGFFSKIPNLGVLIALFIAPAIFTISHIFVFAGQNVEFFHTYIFGFVACVTVLMWKNVFWEWALHVGNNLGVTLFSQLTLMQVLVVMVTNPLFLFIYGIIFLIGGIIFIARKVSG